MGLTRPKTSQIDTTNTKFDDTILVINNIDLRTQPGDIRPDQGIIFSRPGSPAAENVAFIWTEPENEFSFITTANSDSVNGQLTATGFAPIRAGNISVIGNLSVTGTLSLTNAPVMNVYSGNVPSMSGTSIIVSDNTVPTITDGSEIFTTTVTPSSTNSKFELTFRTMTDTSVSDRNVTIAVFRGNTCIHATSTNVPVSGGPCQLGVHINDAPATLSSVTYSARVGINTAATWYINTTSTSIGFNGKAASTYTLTEYN